MSKIITKRYFGLKFSSFEETHLFEEIKNAISNKRKKVIFGYSLSILPKFTQNPEIFYYSDNFDIFLSDGRGLYFLMRLLGIPLKSNISLPNFSTKLLEFSNQNKYKILLFGADKDTNAKATLQIRNKYPNAIILNGVDGYFSKDQEPQIVKNINELRPNILYIGISSPKKERFVAEWLNDLEVNIILPCGGFIDTLAGKTRITPSLIKSLGLAWLYRYLQEPIRLFKPLFLNVLSIVLILFPVLLFNVLIKKNKNFSIPEFYMNK